LPDNGSSVLRHAIGESPALDLFKDKKASRFDLNDTLYAIPNIYTLGIERAWKISRSSDLFSGMSLESFKQCYMDARDISKKAIRSLPSKSNRLIYFHNSICAKSKRPKASLALQMNAAYCSAYEDIDFSVARAVLKELKLKFKIAIVTNQTLDSQLLKLANLDPDGSLIDVFVTSEEAGAEKPDPRIFQLALARLGFSEKEVIMIGDDWDADIGGAAQLGIQSVYLKSITGLSRDSKVIPGDQTPVISSILDLISKKINNFMISNGCSRTDLSLYFSIARRKPDNRRASIPVRNRHRRTAKSSEK
jgi:FMN phosphatase YigB (HAD superfamily)